MSIADKLTTIAENEQKVYDKGKADGKKAEYDNFWDNFQANVGTYNNAFASSLWDDKCYNPKYPIDTVQMANCFANAQITDTKVTCKWTMNSSNIFGGCKKLKTIRTLYPAANLSFSSCFLSCSALENITFDAVISRSINFQQSTKLTVDSMKNIISCLEDFTGTDKEYSYTLTLSSTSWANLEADSTAPNGGTWQEYVSSLGWNTA